MSKSWKNHLTLYVILPISIIVLGTLIVFYAFMSDSVALHQEMAMENFQEKVDQLAEGLDQDLESLMEAQRRLQQSVAVYELINYMPYMDYYTRETLQLDLMSQVNTIISTSRYVNSCFLYIYPINLLVTPDSAVVNDAIDLSAYLSRLKPNASDCQLIIDAKGIYIIRSIWNHVNQRYDSLSVSVLSAETFTTLLGNALPTPQDVLVMDCESGVQFISRHEPEGLDFTDHPAYASASAASKRFGWTMTGYLNLSSNVVLQRRTMTLFYVFSLSMAVLLVLYTVFLFHWLVRPLTLLLGEAFGQVEKGNLEYRIQTARPGLFSKVYSQFNSMTGQLHALTELKITQETLLARATLKQLQAQISPHFLYNSHYVLYRLIKSRRMEESEKMCAQLGRFYQYITRLDQDVLPVREEVEHSKAYIAIQQFRFREKVNVVFEEPPEELAALQVPRLILQPILENTFKYAYDSSAGDPQVNIRVSFRIQQKGIYDILMENNGELTDETLDRMQSMLEEDAGDSRRDTTALTNIHKRLQLYFAPGTGLAFERSALGGLMVRLHIVTEEKHE